MTAPSPAIEQRALTLKFLLALGGYFLLHILLRVTISGSLDYDEAEQAMLGQWLLAGYTEQPPLYTWIQHGLFILFGKNAFAVSLMKNGLLFSTYACVYFAACRILGDRRSAILATCSLLFIPQIAWESQRDMTHTTLVVFAAAATLWQMMRLIENTSLLNYCILGLCLGTGFMAKANYALFLLVAVLALSTFAEGRRIFANRKIVASLAILALFTGTYLLWMAANQDIVFSATHKFKQAVGHYWLRGTLSLIANSFLFLTPLWLICGLIFPSGYLGRGVQDSDFHRRFITRYMIILFLTLLLAVLFFKVTYVKDRWLQPLLFVAPIFFFSRLSPAEITPRKFRTYLTTVLVAALAVYTGFTFRTAGADITDNFCRLNYPFQAFADDMRKSGFTEGLIVSNDRFLAGNFHVMFPSSTAIVPDYRLERLVEDGRYTTVAVVWKVAESIPIPVDLETFLQKTYGFRAAEYPIRYFDHSYLFADEEIVTLGVIIIPRPPVLTNP